MPNDRPRTGLTGVRFSMLIKACVVIGAFFWSLRASDFMTSMFYLVVAIVFAGLLVSQYSWYLRAKRDRTTPPDQPS